MKVLRSTDSRIVRQVVVLPVPLVPVMTVRPLGDPAAVLHQLERVGVALAAIEDTADRASG